MDEKSGDHEYTNCENRGQSLYFIPDSYNDDSEYMAARSTGLLHRTNRSESEYELMGEERSSVKTFVNKFEETLNFHKNDTLELKQRYLEAEVHYANIPQTLRAWNSSEKVPGHRTEHEDEAASDSMYYANDVCMQSLNKKYDRNEESSFSHTANDAASMSGRRARSPSSDSESYCEMQQEDRKGHIRLFDKDSRTDNMGEIECQSKKHEARIVSRIKESKSHDAKVHEVTGNRTLIPMYDSEIRSCEGGELVGRGTVVRNALDVAGKMLTYLNEIRDRVDISLYGNDVKAFLGVANTLKCHIREMRYQNESRNLMEASDAAECLEIGQLQQQQSSQSYTSKEQLETHTPDDYEDQFDQIAEALKASGKQALARRGKTEDVEEGISKGFVFTRKLKICLILAFLVILVAWTVLIYVAVHEEYITIK